MKAVGWYWCPRSHTAERNATQHDTPTNPRTPNHINLPTQIITRLLPPLPLPLRLPLLLVLSAPPAAAVPDLLQAVPLLLEGLRTCVFFEVA